MKYVAFGAALFLAFGAPALAAGDATHGEKVFQNCKACHDVDQGINKVGPTLKGVVGRPIASVANYQYSDDMQALGKQGKVWDEATLTTYLPNPKAMVPKTKMAYAGLKNPSDVADLIAYLQTKK